ncbi:hypothetical protein KSP40_PGU002641 [Platanthera guangdongensis]|uniref:Uncharacterized protein n=1 Tax=Platanthera guangdongensis TaxID=2320717 RepID=A0ABR2M1E1_9ASPA
MHQLQKTNEESPESARLSDLTAATWASGLKMAGSGSGLSDLGPTTSIDASRQPPLERACIPYHTWESLGVHDCVVVVVAAGDEPRVFVGLSPAGGVESVTAEPSGVEPRVFGHSTTLEVAGYFLGTADLNNVITPARSVHVCGEAQLLGHVGAARVEDMDEVANLDSPLDDAELDAMEEAFDPLVRGEIFVNNFLLFLISLLYLLPSRLRVSSER